MVAKRGGVKIRNTFDALFERAHDGYADWLQTEAHRLPPAEVEKIRTMFGNSLLYARGCVEMKERLKR